MEYFTKMFIEDDDVIVCGQHGDVTDCPLKSCGELKVDLCDLVLAVFPLCII